jgi:hypothetical protein
MMDSSNSILREGAARLRRGGLWLIFALVLLIPKVNRLRRRRKTWNSIRILSVIAGAAMLLLAISRGHVIILLLAGSLVLLFGLLVSAERPEISVDARAKELGALITVDGGRYIDAAGNRHRTKLFVGPDRLWALDSALHVVLEVPLTQVQTLFVEPSGADWSFRLEGQQTKAVFIYQGSFAQHLAGVAEATVRSRLNRELPVLR